MRRFLIPDLDFPPFFWLTSATNLLVDRPLRGQFARESPK